MYCSHDLVNCTNFTHRDISQFVSKNDLSQSVNIFVNISDAVDWCTYNGDYLYAYVTVGCNYYYHDDGITSDAPTSAPTSMRRRRTLLNIDATFGVNDNLVVDYIIVGIVALFVASLCVCFYFVHKKKEQQAQRYT